jgi:signal peptidase I
MPYKPKKWLAVLLGTIAPPIAMMYVAQIRWAGVYLLVALAVGVIGKFYLHDTLIGALLSIVFAVTCAAHAYRFAKRYPDEKQRPIYSRWFWLLGGAAGVFLVVFLLRTFAVEPFRFPSGSMLPTIALRSHLVVQKWGYGNYGTYGMHLFRSPITSPLARGDIIVFEFPQDRTSHYAKRLIGLPGDTIAYHAKKLSINGKPVAFRAIADYFDSNDLTYAPAFIESLMGVDYTVITNKDRPASIPASFAFPFYDKCTYGSDGVTCVVPAGHYFTLGDNRDNSNDSRMWGFVPADHIVGKVLYIMP